MDAKHSFLQLFERLEGFVEKLPGPLQKPILKEVVPLKDLFLRERAPRFVLGGDPLAGSAGLFNAIFSAPVAPFAPTTTTDQVPPAAGWQDFSHAGRGVLRVLDARVPAPGDPLADVTQTALDSESADLILFLSTGDDARLVPDLDTLETLLDLAEQRHQARPCVLGVVVNSTEGEPPAGEMDAERARLQAALAARPKVARHLAPALDVATFMRFRLDGTFDPDSDRRYHIAQLVHSLVAEVPNEARLAMARLSGAREAQARIAQTLINSTAAVSGALGAQPIPLADLPFLLTFQLAMVAGIIYVSGREMSLKLAAEFLGTMGINFGLGLALRESARAAIRALGKLLLPGVGNAISGFVAASGTYAIGRAASAYYIEGMNLADAKRLFDRSQRPDQGIFHLLDRRKSLPKSTTKGS